MQRTLIIVKPDGIKKGLNENFIEAALKDVGGKCIDLQRTNSTLEKAKMHYQEHEGSERFDRITKALCDGEIIVAIAEGENIISRFRQILGSSSQPKTLRGRFTTPGSLHLNAIHASDSVESAEREIALWTN